MLYCEVIWSEAFLMFSWKYQTPSIDASLSLTVNFCYIHITNCYTGSKLKVGLGHTLKCVGERGEGHTGANSKNYPSNSNNPQRIAPLISTKIFHYK